MATHAILAEKTVSISEARKSLNDYFLDEPVAVLSNNKTAGYMLSAELYERMVQLIEASTPEVKSTFRPSAARLEAVAKLNEELLLNASDQDLDDFEE